jgi:hypothetical protein
MPDREARADLTHGGPPDDDPNPRTAKPSAETLRDRLLTAFEMFEFGVNMMAANLRRRHPDASPEEIDRMVDAWLLERPGAEEGDGPGIPVPLERFR